MTDRTPPLPRARDSASFSELVPFRSTKIRVARSPIFWFLVVAAAMNVFLFGLIDVILAGKDIQTQYDAFELFEKLVLFYILALSLLAIHAYTKTDKSILGYVIPCLAVYCFMVSPLWDRYYELFAPFSGEPASKKSADFLVRLWGYSAGTGLREEGVKAAPILIGALLTRLAGRGTGAAPPRFGPLLGLVRVRSPLDGVLMGFAAGCAFLFYETSGQYVHDIMHELYTSSGGNALGAFGGGLMLLLPRAMNGWVGHMAWSGIVGYFVGLAMIRRRGGLAYIVIGLVVAATLHGLWDAVGSAEIGRPAEYATAGLTGLLTIGCLLKARQLEAAVFGTGLETSGSIVVPAGFVPAAPPTAPTPRAAAPPTPPGPVSLWPEAPAPLLLDLQILKLPLAVGAVLDLAAQPGLSGWADGVKGEVTSHPTNPAVCGLKNQGLGTWYARLRDNSIQSVEPQRSLRLAAGISIDFGGGLVGRVVAP